LRIFKHSFTLSTHVEKVWEFYTDIEHLNLVTPKEVNLKVLDSTGKRFIQGTQFWIRGRILLFPIEWHSVIKSITPYEYVDEMLSGPFRRWVHLHKFRYDFELKQTQVVDEVGFELPYGMLGKLLDGLAIYELQKIFEYRKKTTVELLGNG
jgi:ligand-binding SRPBCC domain-containing protein